ncbi:MAG: Trp family transcriptional regulator [Candidatus Gracilibacteria bacterium]
MKKNFIKELAGVIVQIDDLKLAEDFLSAVLTPAELEEVARRLQIFKLLKQGMPQHQVSEKLKVGIETVSRGSRELKYGKPRFHAWWQPLSRGGGGFALS